MMSKKTEIAKEFLNRSVLHIHDNIDQSKLFMGVKDTPLIKKSWIELLGNYFTFHTIDKMAYKGRAVDADLINPLTFRLMTGSSSGTAINVLMGINDIGLGTDGGGSVIYPAISTNIYSVMLAGIGFQTNTIKKSTDNISFSPSLGIMAFNKEILNKAISLLVNTKNVNQENVSCNDIIIAGEEKALKHLNIKGYAVDIIDSDNREELINFMNEVFKQYDILIVKETQIDIHSYGESVLGTTGTYFSLEQKKSNKRLGKILNMIEASVFTIPDKEAASAYLIIAKKGNKYFQIAWQIFNSVSELRTKLFLEYFGLNEK